MSDNQKGTQGAKILFVTMQMCDYKGKVDMQEEEQDPGDPKYG